MAAALRIELRLAESKSAVLTVIRYRYVAWVQGLEPRLTVLAGGRGIEPLLSGLGSDVLTLN